MAKLPHQGTPSSGDYSNLSRGDPIPGQHVANQHVMETMPELHNDR